MPVVTFMPANLSVSVEPGAALLSAARAAGVQIQAPCGGNGTCGKCIVRIVHGDVDSDSLAHLDQQTVADGYVLACKTRLLDGPVTVQIAAPDRRQGGKFTDANADMRLVRQELLPKKWHYEPLAIKWLLEVTPPTLEDGRSDLDRLVAAVQRDWGKLDVQVSLPLMRTIAQTVRAMAGKITVTLIRQAQCLHVVGIEPGDTTTHHYGIAIDVGTTTVAVQLVFLPLAKVLASRTDYNDQICCGLDVISRINYARTSQGLEELRQRVLETINRLIRQVAEAHNLEQRLICNAVISGNTSMVHLLLGLPPEHIRLDPYTPTILQVPFLNAAELDLQINPQSWIWLSPAVGSYVGGDITAGLLCTDLATDTEELNFFIDIGTNGEIVLGNSEFLMTCACSAGPAFEGGGIGCGMRAALGAIERVRVEPVTGKATYSTIGQVPPQGICGSGMIALLADLLVTGWLDAAGKLDRSRPSPAIRLDGRHAYYIIASAAESGTGNALSISEVDIANIIRAKAAIYSACALLLEQVGITFHDLAHVYIAGGFGRFLDLEKAKVIGLIPDLPKHKFRYIGNSSLLGSYMVLVSRDYQQRQIALAQRMTYVDLSSAPGYMDQYTGAMFLPHTDPEQFPTVQALLAADASAQTDS